MRREGSGLVIGLLVTGADSSMLWIKALDSDGQPEGTPYPIPFVDHERVLHFAMRLDGSTLYIMYTANSGDNHDPAGAKLMAISLDRLLASDDHPIPKPSTFQLAVFPNPFNPATEIRFDLDRTRQVDLRVFDLTGREVAVLLQQTLPSGNHGVKFDGASLASGIYFARLSAGPHVATSKLVLLK